MSEQKYDEMTKQGFCGMLFNTFLCILFYRYWEYNPDAGTCWANENTTLPRTTYQFGFVNVTDEFISWFKWGFILTLASVINNAI